MSPDCGAPFSRELPGVTPSHWSGRGGSTHHGRSSWLIRTTHLTQWYPRRPGTTRRTGAPCAEERLAPSIAVATSSWSVNGSRREYPVALVTSTVPRAPGGSSLLKCTPDHSCSVHHPPVQSRTATCLSCHCQTSVVRIGTWNLASRWSPDHERLMAAQECDVWLLTEVNERVELPGMRRHIGQEHMAARRHWAAIFSHHHFEPLEDPHPASASVHLGDTTFVSSVLPWRSCGARHPWIGTRHEEKTQAAVRSVFDSLQGSVVWGGDWNHALHGPEYAGSQAGRAHIQNAIGQLELQVPTELLPHRIDGLLSIDLVAVPAGALVQTAERVAAATDQKRLSDHDAYVVTVQE